MHPHDVLIGNAEFRLAFSFGLCYHRKEAMWAAYEQPLQQAVREMHELILVRHGESEHHVKSLTGGWTDTPLTDRGRRQAQRLAHGMARNEQYSLGHLISSDLLRARQTAEIIAETAGIKPVYRMQLRELNNGEAKGKSLAQAKKMELPNTQPALEWIPYPGAESWKAMSLRIIRLMDQLNAQFPEDRVVVVSHGNAMVAIVHWWLNLGEEYWSKISFEFACASITRLTVNPWGERTISKLNDTSHLIGI
jgi:probable phosphoglycerate mutase